MNARNADAVGIAFGSVLRNARLEAELSQAVLSRKTPLDRTYLSQLERGVRQPTLAVLIALGNALDIETHALVRLTTARLRETGMAVSQHAGEAI